METSKQGAGSNSWNIDYSEFPAGGNTFFNRGGIYIIEYLAGIFNYYSGNGITSFGSGFRVVLIPD